MRETQSRINPTRGNTMYVTVPAEIVTDTFFPFERSGDKVRIRLSGRAISVSKERQVDVSSRLDSFLSICHQKFGETNLWEYSDGISIRELMPWITIRSLSDPTMDQKHGVVEALGWALNLALFGVATGNLARDGCAYLLVGVRLGLSKYNHSETPLRHAVNYALSHLRAMVMDDFDGFHTAHAIEKTALRCHHNWIGETARDIGIEREVELPEEAYHAGQFVLLVGVAISTASTVGFGNLSRSEIDPFGSQFTKSNARIAEALLYTLKILETRDKLNYATASTPRVLDFEDIIAQGMLELSVPSSDERPQA